MAIDGFGDGSSCGLIYAGKVRTKTVSVWPAVATGKVRTVSVWPVHAVATGKVRNESA